MLRPAEELPFLENFLVDAEHFWATQATGRLRSGPWTETDPSGKVYVLEANAVSSEEKKILLIEWCPHSYREKHSAVQKGRELRLAYERLERLERERRQAEEALRESEEKYRTIFDAANDTIFINDVETGDIVDVNEENV